MNVAGVPQRTVAWEDGAVVVVDQAKLPFAFEKRRLRGHEEVAEAIRSMVVRGAPAIGAAGAFGMALAFREKADPAAARSRLVGARPTGRNLAGAVDRVAAAGAGRALEEAQRIADEDVAACLAIGRAGRPLIREGMRILTHCNAGWLATVDWGTQTAPLYLAWREGVRFEVLVDRTGPRDQGARLTAWELAQEGIPHRIIEDGASGHFMRRGEVDLAIVGADRIAANGDVANKIGTYLVALAARDNGVPFHVAAPRDTFDRGCPDGASIPIEERDPDEVLYRSGPDEAGVLRRVRVANPGSGARNPAFDVTPARLVTSYLTPAGVRTSP